MERAHPNRNLVSTEQIQGQDVYNDRGERIGKIDHLMIDKKSGRVTYVVMSFGGVLGLGHNHYPLPWNAISYDPDLEGFKTSISEAQLKDAPQFTDDRWGDREWEARLHDHYGAPYYW